MGNIIFELDVGHTLEISSISISKDKKFLLTGSLDNISMLINISSRTVIKRFVGHSKEIRCVIFGNDNDIFTASQDTTIKRWRGYIDSSSDDSSSDDSIHTYFGHKFCVGCILIVVNKLVSSSWDNTTTISGVGI